MPIENRHRVKKNFVDKYEVLDANIGIGGFATVIKARNRMTGKIVAVKMFLKPKPGKETAKILAEAHLMRKLKHKYIVRCYEVFEPTVSDPNAYIVMGLMNSDLYEVLNQVGSFPEAQASRMIKIIT